MAKSTAGLALALCVTLAGSGVWGSEQYLLLRLDGHLVKWGRADLRTGAQVRYGFVTGAMRFAGARNCAGMVGLESLLERSRIELWKFRSEVAMAFALWAAAADIKFEAVDDPNDADILIGAQAVPRGWAFANVSYDRSATSSVRPIDKSLICLNPTKPWKTDFGGDSSAYDLRYTIAHEIGHAIGLDHPDSDDQLMSVQYGERFRTLQSGDFNGAIALYGSAHAPATAKAPDAGRAGLPEMGLR